MHQVGNDRDASQPHANAARLKDLLAQALDRPEADRRAFLEGECGDDRALLDEAESLVRAAEASGFLKSPTASFVADLPPSESAGGTIGPYKLLQQIGEGGFGAVFMAEQTEPIRRRVALKVIKLGMDTRQVVARFEQERQALAVMDHPHIAKVFDAGATASGRPYFVMELVKGQPITEYCDRQGLSVPERLELFSQVCHAVQHAHTKGVIHRDIKPRNVLVSTHDGKPLVKVIDFGIAKATDQRMTEKTLFTEHQAMIGTPEYMSPEQAEGSLDIDTRTDVYSLGVLLYELLTGATPFDGKSLREAGYGEICRIIRDVDPPRPSVRVSTNAQAAWAKPATTNAESPSAERVAHLRKTDAAKLFGILKGDLDWVVMKALEKDRARRYATPTTLAEDVARYLAGDAVTAVPPSRWYRVRKFVRRNRTGVVMGGTALVAVALVASAAVTARRSAVDAQAMRTRNDELKWSEASALENVRIAASAAHLSAAILALASERWNEAERLLSELDPELQHFEFALTATALNEVPRLEIGESPRHVDAEHDILVTVLDGTYQLRLLPNGSLATSLEVPADRTLGEGYPKFQISPDGKRLSSLESGRAVLTWSLEDGRLIHSVDLSKQSPAETTEQSYIHDLNFSPDARWVLDEREDGVVRLWSVLTDDPPRVWRKGDNGRRYVNADFDPSGGSLALKDWGGGIEIVDPRTGYSRISIQTDCDCGGGIEFWNSELLGSWECGEFVVRASRDGVALSRWESTTAPILLDETTCIREGGLFSPEGELLNAEWRGEGARGNVLIPGSFAFLSDVNTRPAACSLVTGYSTTLVPWPWAQMFPSKCGTWILAQHFDWQTWSLSSARVGLGTDASSTTPVVVFGLDSGGSSVLTLHPDALLTFDPMRIDRFPVSGVLPNVLLGAGSADGERLVAINQDSLQVIDADGLHERLRLAHDGANTRAVALSATGDLLVLLSASGELSLRSPLDGSVIARGQAPAEFASASPRCAIGNDGSIAVTNGRGDVVLFTRSGSTLTESARTSLSGGAVTALVAVPARKEFLVGMKDGSAHVVDEASLAVRVTLPTNGHAIGAMTPSFDGLRYFTASDDGSIRIWHAETGKELLTLNEERITAAPTAIFIEPNNERLVVGYANGAERIWDAVTWAERVRRRGKPEWPNTEPKLVPAESHPATDHER